MLRRNKFRATSGHEKCCTKRPSSAKFSIPAKLLRDYSKSGTPNTAWHLSGLALETITSKDEPFSLVSTPAFSTDARNRITLFALSLLPTDNASSMNVIAEDGNSQFYQLTVEYVGILPECDGVSYIIVKLDEPLSEVGDVLLGLSAHGLSSNRVRIGIGYVGGGPADDPPASPTPTPFPSPSPTPGTTHTITGQVREATVLG